MPRENESIKKSVRLILLLKARVHGHLRHLSSGATVWVSEHEDRRERRQARDPNQGMLFGAEALPDTQTSLPFQAPASDAAQDVPEAPAPAMPPQVVAQPSPEPGPEFTDKLSDAYKTSSKALAKQRAAELGMPKDSIRQIESRLLGTVYTLTDEGGRFITQPGVVEAMKRRYGPRAGLAMTLLNDKEHGQMQEAWDLLDASGGDVAAAQVAARAKPSSNPYRALDDKAMDQRIQGLRASHWVSPSQNVPTAPPVFAPPKAATIDHARVRREADTYLSDFGGNRQKAIDHLSDQIEIGGSARSAFLRHVVDDLKQRQASVPAPAPEPPPSRESSAIPAGIGSAEFHHAMDKLISEHGAGGTSILLDRAERDPNTTVFRPPMIAALRAELERRHPGTRADVDGLRAAMIEHEKKKQALAAPVQAEEPPHDSFEDEIPMSAAVAAHAGTSHSPESRGAYMRREYAATLRRDLDMLSKYATTPEKKALLAQEFDRYHAGYRRKYMAYLHARASLISPMIAGPSKFPTRRAEKASNASDKRGQEADDFRESALAAIKKKLTPELQPIMSSDTNAVERIEDKIAKLEKLQERMRSANVAIRTNKKAGPEAQIAALVGLGFSAGRAAELLKPDFAGRIGFPDYALTNNSANIRRLKQRSEQVTETQAAPVAQTEGTAATIEDDPPANRVRLLFPGKPDAATRAKLKAAGFRWAPSTGVWQAYRNYRSMTVANEVAGVKKALPALVLLKASPAPTQHDPTKAQHVQSTRGGDGRELHWYRSPEGHYYSSDVPPAARKKDAAAPGEPGTKPADTTERSEAEREAQGGEDRPAPDFTEHEIEDTKTGLIFRVRLAPKEKKALGVEK